MNNRYLVVSQYLSHTVYRPYKIQYRPTKIYSSNENCLIFHNALDVL